MESSYRAEQTMNCTDQCRLYPLVTRDVRDYLGWARLTVITIAGSRLAQQQ